MSTPQEANNTLIKGLADFHIAEVTTNTNSTYTTQTPELLAPALTGKLKLTYESETIYGSDTAQYSESNFKDGELEIEIFNLTPEQVALIYGHRNYRGMNIANANDVAKPVAISWRSKLTKNSGYHFFQLYNCQASGEEEMSFESIADKSKTQPVKIKFTIMPRAKDQEIKVDVNESYLDKTTNDDIADLLSVDITTNKIKWFKQVVEPVAEIKPTGV